MGLLAQETPRDSGGVEMAQSLPTRTSARVRMCTHRCAIRATSRFVVPSRFCKARRIRVWWAGRSVVRMLKSSEGGEAQAAGRQSLGQVSEKRKRSRLM